MSNSTNRYDVQILKAGVWTWAGVTPSPRRMGEARADMKKMKGEACWKAWGVESFRVSQTGFTTKGIAL